MIDMKIVEEYVELFTGPGKEPAILELSGVWAMLAPIRHLIQKDARYLIAIRSGVIAIDPGHVIKEILGGTPTLTALEIDAIARRILRSKNYRDADSVIARLGKADLWMVNGRLAEIKEGTKASRVVPFELRELS